MKAYLALRYTDLLKGHVGLPMTVQDGLRITRPTFARHVDETMALAEAPDRLVANGLMTPILITQVLMARYRHHKPLYRQSQICARRGVDRVLSTLTG